MNPINDYVNELELVGKSKGYVDYSRKVLTNFKKSNTGNGILNVNEDDVKEYLLSLRNRNLCESTISDYMKAVNRFYEYLNESEKYNLSCNPAKRITKMLNHKKKQTKRPIKSIEEISNFIRNIHNPRDRAMVVLFAKTGIRNGELTALNIEDIDFDNEVLNIDKHIDDKSKNTIAKGRKNGVETLIPLDDETIRTLQFYLITRPKSNNKALFLSHNGYRLNMSDVTRIVKDWSIKTNIGKDTKDTDKKIVPHFFRAWFTYQLQINGCNPIVIDAIRGDRAGTIRDFYSNQVLPFDFIKNDYLRVIHKFGI